MDSRFVIRIHPVEAGGAIGSPLQAIDVGKEYIVIGISEDLSQTVHSSVKATSLPFFLLRTLAKTVLPPGDTR